MGYVRRCLIISPFIVPNIANILQLHTPAMKMAAQYLNVRSREGGAMVIRGLITQTSSL